MSALQLLDPTVRAERVARAAADVVCLAGVAADLAAVAESGDTGRVHVLGAVVRALLAQAANAHALADEVMMLAHRTGAAAQEGAASLSATTATCGRSAPPAGQAPEAAPVDFIEPTTAVVSDVISDPLSQDFRAGLELFDQMLSATIEVGDKSGPHQEPSCWLEAEFRHGHPFKPHALPFVLRLLEHPEMADGFSAALGNCLASAYGGSAIHGTVPTTYSALTDEQILGPIQQTQEVNHV